MQYPTYQVPDATIMACDLNDTHSVFHGPGACAVVRERKNLDGKVWVNLGGLIGWLQYDRHAMVPVKFGAK